MRSQRLRRSAPIVALVALVAAGGCSSESDQELRTKQQNAIFGSLPQEWSEASPEHQDWATSVGMLFWDIDTSPEDNQIDQGVWPCTPEAAANEECVANLNFTPSDLCPGEPFADQYSPRSACTTFMIDEDVFATAAHCIEEKSLFDLTAADNWQLACEELKVLMRWRPSAQDPEGNLDVFDKHVYQCTEVLAHGTGTSKNNPGPDDWAIFRVDRPVRPGGGSPLDPNRKARPIGVPKVSTGNLTVGHPRGIPTKLDPDAEIYEVENSVWGKGMFSMRADGGKGSSGGPVFDSDGNIVGIMSGGARNIKRKGESCYRWCSGDMPAFECKDWGARRLAIGAVDIRQIPQKYRPASGDFLSEGLQVTTRVEEVAGFIQINVDHPTDGESTIDTGVPASTIWLDEVHIVVGDFTGDDADELVLVAGDTAYLYEGDPSASAGQPPLEFGMEIAIPTPDPATGYYETAAAEDADGDGHDDILLTDADGRSITFFGGADPFSSSSLAPSQQLRGFDYDGDGLEDFAVGAEAEPGESRGRVLVVMANDTTTTLDQELVHGSDAPAVEHNYDDPYAMGHFDSDRFGAAIAWGDFDGDGISHEIVVGAPETVDDGSGQVGSLSYIPFARPAELITPSALGLDTKSPQHFGERLAAGDFNGDGVDDLAVSAPRSPQFKGGFVTSIHGEPQVGITSDPAFLGETYDDDFFGLVDNDAADLPAASSLGHAIAAGDFNCDGTDDLAISAPTTENGHGRVFVIEGSEDGLTSEFRTLSFPARDDDDLVGLQLTAGNFNGDSVNGRPCVDLAVASRNRIATYHGRHEAGLRTNSSTMYDSLPDSSTIAIWQIDAMSLANISDDGHDDLIVLSNGELLLFQGQPLGLSTEESATYAVGVNGVAEPDNVLSGEALQFKGGSRSIRGQGSVYGKYHEIISVGAMSKHAVMGFSPVMGLTIDGTEQRSAGWGAFIVAKGEDGEVQGSAQLHADLDQYSPILSGTPIRGSFGGAATQPRPGAVGYMVIDPTDAISYLSDLTDPDYTNVEVGEPPFGVFHAVPGDVDDSGCTDQADLSIIHQSDVWLQEAILPTEIGVRADVTRDGWVNEEDEYLVLKHWGAGCVNQSPAPVPPHCSNGVTGAGETDVDCGGNCLPCQEGAACNSNVDCLSGTCIGNECTTAETVVCECNSTKCQDCSAQVAACESISGCLSIVGCTQASSCAFPHEDCVDGLSCHEASGFEQSSMAGQAANNLISCMGGCTVAGPPPATCNDNILNQDESDVDCGGTCGASCELGSGCGAGSDCVSGTCEAGACVEPAPPSSTCDEESATELANRGSAATFPNDACLRVRDSYPSWWGSRTMQLQTLDGGSYDVPFTWTNSCSGSSGADMFTGNWQSKDFGPTDAQCATVIKLQGDGTGTVQLRYY